MTSELSALLASLVELEKKTNEIGAPDFTDFELWASFSNALPRIVALVGEMEKRHAKELHEAKGGAAAEATWKERQGEDYGSY